MSARRDPHSPGKSGNEVELPAPGEEWIAFEDVRKSFGGREILAGLDWSLRRGDRAVVLGPSGSGKSVLLSILLGFLKPDGGNVRRHPALGEDPFRRIAVLFQDDALLDDRTIEENLATALLERFGATGPFDAETDAAIDRALMDVGLDAARVRGQLPSGLSGGMRRRVALARALIRSPDILIADEPTTGLDPETSEAIFALMGEAIAARGATAVVVTHDPLCAVRFGDPIYWFAPRAERLRSFERPAGAAPPSREDVLAWAERERERESEEESPAGAARSVPSPLPGPMEGVDALGRTILAFEGLRSPPEPRALLRGLEEWGAGTAPLVAIIFALLGLVSEIQVENSVADLGFSDRVPELLALMLTRLAPIVAGFLIAGRCGSAATARIAWMNLSGQLKALTTMRIDPGRAILPPLFWSWVLAAPALAAFGLAAGAGAAWLTIAAGVSRADVTPRYFAMEFVASLDAATLGTMGLKAALMAAGMAVVAYGGGAWPKRSAADATAAITRGLVLSFVWIAVVDACVSLAAGG